MRPRSVTSGRSGTYRGWAVTGLAALLVTAFVVLPAPVRAEHDTPAVACGYLFSPWTCQHLPPVEQGCEAVFAETVCDPVPDAKEAIEAVDEELCAVAPVTVSQQCWVARYDGPAEREDYGRLTAVSADGETVFVAGPSIGDNGNWDFAVVAYRTADGSVKWEARYDGPAESSDYLQGLAVSEDAVVVTGYSYGGASRYDFATVAYDPGNGLELWEARFNHELPSNWWGGGADDYAIDVEIGDDGTVYALGYGFTGYPWWSGDAGYYDWHLVAYDGADGTELWRTRFNDPFNGYDYARALAVSPDGDTLFATGYGQGQNGYYDYYVAAYDASTGAQQWVGAWDGPGNRYDYPQGIAVLQSAVVVTGYTLDQGWRYDYGTVAYDPADGTLLWDVTYDGPAGDYDYATGVAAAADGDTVVVSGYARDQTTGYDYTTVGYAVADGAESWVASYAGPTQQGYHDAAFGVALSPDGTKAFVTGYSYKPGQGYDYATVAYDVADGAELWEERYDGDDNHDYGQGVAVSPDGLNVYVTGYSIEGDGWNAYDFGTLKYNALQGVLAAVSSPASAVPAVPDPGSAVDDAEETAHATIDEVEQTVHDTCPTLFSDTVCGLIPPI